MHSMQNKNNSRISYDLTAKMETISLSKVNKQKKTVVEHTQLLRVTVCARARYEFFICFSFSWKKKNQKNKKQIKFSSHSFLLAQKCSLHLLNMPIAKRSKLKSKTIFNFVAFVTDEDFSMLLLSGNLTVAGRCKYVSTILCVFIHHQKLFQVSTRAEISISERHTKTDKRFPSTNSLLIFFLFLIFFSFTIKKQKKQNQKYQFNLNLLFLNNFLSLCTHVWCTMY